MWVYVVRRLLYTIPIVLGVLLITFLLFKLIPGDISAELAGKAASPETIAQIRAELDWDKPLLLNFQAARQRGPLAVFESQFFIHFKKALTFNFGRSIRSKESIATMLRTRAGPSLTLMLPMFVIGMVSSLTVALIVAMLRGTAWDYSIVFICVLGMSVPYLAFILFGQYYFAYKLQWFPIIGYEPGLGAWRYLALPVLIGVVAGLGAEVRFYRTVMLDEMNADYVRTAYAKGVATRRVLFVHVLKNAMIPVLTRVVLAIPFLFLGSLLLERLFGIPGLGDMTIQAINSRDFPVVSAVTFIISILFALGNLATDLSYALVDPRISLS